MGRHPQQVNLSGNCGLSQCHFQAKSSSDPKPEGWCVNCVRNTISLNPEAGAESPVGTLTEGTFESLTGVESPVWTPAEGAFEPLDSTGAQSPVGTSTEGAVARLDLAGVGGLRVIPTEGTGGSHPEVGTDELFPIEGKEESRYSFGFGEIRR